MAPRITIVVPTRNRQLLARVAVRSALELGSDVEVVVADNNDVPMTFPDDPRIRVLPRPPQPISMTENWERALHATTGEWVTFISDKHRVVPGLYRRAIDQAESAGVKLVAFERACLFQKLANDDISDDTLWNAEGTLFSPDLPERSELRSAKDTLREWHRVIRGAPHRPQIYRGAVHRSVIESVLRKSSRFFFGTCPDYASGLQSMSEVDNYLSTNLPATMVQVPTADINAWAPAQSLDAGGKLGHERVKEAGYESFARYNLPFTVTSAILETILEFRRHRPDVPQVEIDWRRYARLASAEIEAMSVDDRLAMHRLVAKVTQREGITLGPLTTQLRVVVSQRRPDVTRAYLRLKDLLGITPPPPPVSRGSWSNRPVESLTAARAELERAFIPTQRAVS